MEWVKLGNVVDIKTGKLNANAAVENGKYPFFTTAEEISRIDTYSYDDEVVLVAGNGELNVKYYKGKFDAYQRTYILTLKENQNYILRFIYYFLSSYIKILRYQAIGGVIKYIKLENLTEAKLPVLTIREQEKLINIFENLEKLIQTRQDQVQALDDLVESYFFQITENENLEKINLSRYILESQNGISRRGDDEDGNVVLKIPNIRYNYIDLSNINKIKLNCNEKEKYKLNQNDLLVTRVNGNPEYVGRSTVFNIENNDYFFNDHLIRLKVYDISPRYLSYYINSIYCKEYLLRNIKTSAGQYTISRAGLDNIKILSPDISLQNKFNELFDKVEYVKQILNDSLKELTNLFDSLMQDAFDGSMSK